MSTLKVDTILKRTGTGTITVGQSGDTISIPSGASLSAAGLGKIGQIVDSGTSPNQAEIGSSSFTALTDGSTALSASITPSATSSNVLMMVSIQTRIANAKGYGVQFNRAGTQVFASQGSYEIFNNNAQDIYGRNDWIFYDTGISTTSATEYTVFLKTDGGGNVKFQNNNDVSKIFLWEILA